MLYAKDVLHKLLVYADGTRRAISCVSSGAHMLRSRRIKQSCTDSEVPSFDCTCLGASLAELRIEVDIRQWYDRD